jgi:hypothetical protein
MVIIYSKNLHKKKVISQSELVYIERINILQISVIPYNRTGSLLICTWMYI